MPYDLIIRGGTVVRETGATRADIAIEDEKIAAIAPEILSPATESIDATGLHVFPGVIDPHVHFNEPGRTTWEGIATGSAALAAGGGTCFFDMPLNSSPPVLDGKSFDAKLAAMSEKSLTDFALWGGLTPVNLDKLEELAARGVIGFKAFMSGAGIDDFPRADSLTLYRGMKTAAALKLPVAVHAENEEITSLLTWEAVANERLSPRDYLGSRPICAEVEAIATAIALAGETGCRLHIVHVSSSRGAELVERAGSAFGADVTCEVCPHHLILSDNDLEQLGPRAKCAPPLRSADENEKLWRDLADGRFAFVASDHSPSPPDMKVSENFFKIWGGIAGVQSTLPILLTREPRLPLERVAAITATTAAQRFRVASKGAIENGYDADFALVDLNATYELTRDELLDRHKLSPYVGRTFRGCVRRTISRGRTIFLDGKIVAKPAGRLIKPA